MSLYVDPTIPRFTRAELLADVAGQGYGFSAAAFRDWQSKGLIADADRDRRWSDGRPGSEPGLWSENQRKCLIALLGLRDQYTAAKPPPDISGLGNVVVWWWLYWDGIVELPQARKALRTWVRPQLGGPRGGARSPQRLRKAAGATVRQLAGQGSRRSTRTQVAASLADLYWTDDQPGLGRLIADVRAVMDPASTGRVVGSTVEPVRPDQVGRCIEAPIRAAHALLADPASLTDQDWDFGRRFLRHAWSEYVRDQPLLAGTNLDHAFGYQHPEVAMQVRGASRSLLTVLGLRILDRLPAVLQ